MGRRSGFAGFVTAVARDVARTQRQAEAARRRQEAQALRSVREAGRAVRLAERDARQAARESRQAYMEARSDEAGEKNEELRARIDELSTLLDQTLDVDDAISFESLRLTGAFHPFTAPSNLAQPGRAPNRDDFARGIEVPRGLSKFLPGAEKRHQERLQAATQAFEEAQRQFAQAEVRRAAALSELREGHERERRASEAKAAQRNEEVAEFEAAYRSGDANAVVAYTTMVLERSRYPEGFPQEFRVAYVPDSRQLVVDYELPGPSIVPTVAEYRHNKTKDSIEEKPRKAAEVKADYQAVVAAIALRTVHEVFEADTGGHLDVAVFSGFVQTVDAATGRDIKPCLLSVRATKARFLKLDLARVDTRACLRNLGAQVSPHAYEVQAVKPIVEFDMVDKRFVEQSEVLADLESRPNLIELTPFEFENLVSNLFSQMGLETKQTRSSHDGGVDAVAFDARPVVGGKVVLQAKRYSNTVGVAAVRDLYGTMINEGANKGILVTTSGYGPDAFDFAKDKPLELIDGAGLLYLLDQIGVKARIVFPQEGGGVA